MKRSACYLTLVVLGLGLQPLEAQAFSITNFSLSAGGARRVGFPANPASYYILYAGAVVTGINQPLALSLGTASGLQLQDAAPQQTAQFYRVAEVPLAHPLDSDGDGIDDVFELGHPGCLNPLDPTDASADCDGDGRSNLQEYYAGTDPGVADAPPRLVINEVDYDQPGSGDATEFVEVLNAGTNSIRLDFYSLAFINGANNTEYLRFNLSGSLDAGHYLVVGSTNLTGIAPAARVLYFEAGENSIQNGAPDGLALINRGLLAVSDAFSYEGAITAAAIAGFPGTVSLVEGTALPASVADSNTTPGSLARLPDGVDTDNAASDWAFTATPTPGSANLP